MILNRDTMRARGHVVRSRLFARCLILETVDRIDRYNIRDFRALREITRFPGRNRVFLEQTWSRLASFPPRRVLHAAIANRRCAHDHDV